MAFGEYGIGRHHGGLGHRQWMVPCVSVPGGRLGRLDTVGVLTGSRRACHRRSSPCSGQLGPIVTNTGTWHHRRGRWDNGVRGVLVAPDRLVQQHGILRRRGRCPRDNGRVRYVDNCTVRRRRWRWRWRRWRWRRRPDLGVAFMGPHRRVYIGGGGGMDAGRCVRRVRRRRHSPCGLARGGSHGIGVPWMVVDPCVGAHGNATTTPSRTNDANNPWTAGFKGGSVDGRTVFVAGDTEEDVGGVGNNGNTGTAWG